MRRREAIAALGSACAAPFSADALYSEVVTAGPYRGLSRADFDACLDFAASGGYALRAYDRWQRLMLRDRLWRLRDPRAAKLLRMNVGTIVEAEMLKVRLRGRGGAPLGEVEEGFAASLSPGDSFLCGGDGELYAGRFERDPDGRLRIHLQSDPDDAAGGRVHRFLASAHARGGFDGGWYMRNPLWRALPENGFRVDA